METYISRVCPKTEQSALPTPMTSKGRPSIVDVLTECRARREKLLRHICADEADAAARVVFRLREIASRVRFDALDLRYIRRGRLDVDLKEGGRARLHVADAVLFSPGIADRAAARAQGFKII